jgi:hypothetical protein
MNMSEIEDREREINFVTLAYFAKSTEAEMARELLANNGVDAVLQGAFFGGLSRKFNCSCPRTNSNARDNYTKPSSKAIARL